MFGFNKTQPKLPTVSIEMALVKGEEKQKIKLNNALYSKETRVALHQIGQMSTPKKGEKRAVLENVQDLANARKTLKESKDHATARKYAGMVATALTVAVVVVAALALAGVITVSGGIPAILMIVALGVATPLLGAEAYMWATDRWTGVTAAEKYKDSVTDAIKTTVRRLVKELEDGKGEKKLKMLEDALKNLKAQREASTNKEFRKEMKVRIKMYEKAVKDFNKVMATLFPTPERKIEAIETELASLRKKRDKIESTKKKKPVQEKIDALKEKLAAAKAELSDAEEVSDSESRRL